MSKENEFLKIDLTSFEDDIMSLQQEVKSFKGRFNALNIENKNLILDNKKLKENITTMTEIIESVEQLK